MQDDRWGGSAGRARRAPPAPPRGRPAGRERRNRPGAPPRMPPSPSSGFAVAGRRRGGAGGTPGTIRGGQLSKSATKAPRAGIDREKKPGIPTIRFRRFSSIRVFATDLDKRRRRGRPRAPRMPLTDSRAAAARLGVKASGGIRPDRLAGDNRRSGAPAVDDEDPPMKVIQWAHGGALLFGPFMCGWTTVLQPLFPRAGRASRGPGRSGPRCQVGSSSASPSQRHPGRRGPRDRRVTAEHVT